MLKGITSIQSIELFSDSSNNDNRRDYCQTSTPLNICNFFAVT